MCTGSNLYIVTPSLIRFLFLSNRLPQITPQLLAYHPIDLKLSYSVNVILCSEHHQAKTKVSARVSSHLKALGGKSTFSLGSAVSRIQGLGSMGLRSCVLLGVSWMPLSAPRGHPSFFGHWISSILLSSKVYRIFSDLETLTSVPASWRKCIMIRPPWTNLPWTSLVAQ